MQISFQNLIFPLFTLHERALFIPNDPRTDILRHGWGWLLDMFFKREESFVKVYLEPYVPRGGVVS